MIQRPLDEILASARLPRQSAVDALFAGPTLSQTAEATSSERVDWQVQEFVDDHWLPVVTLASEQRVRARLADLRRVHRPADRTFRLVEVVTTRVVRVVEP